MMHRTRSLSAFLVLAAISQCAVYGQTSNGAVSKPRVVITADPELDDNDTLIRGILYTTDFQVEGLVYQSSTFHWKSDGKGTTQNPPPSMFRPADKCPCTEWRWPTEEPYTHFIDAIVDAYAKSYENLKVHDPSYPTPAYLKSRIKWGNVEFEGDYSKETEGSNLIKELLLDSKPGPLYVTAQGGQSTIARALKSIYEEYGKTPRWKAIQSKVSKKLIIIPFGDQDGTYARYIKPNWPDVAEWDLEMITYGYGIRNTLTPQNQHYVGAEWTEANVLTQGPLGAMYRVWGDGKKMDPTDTFGFRSDEPKDSFISEGDTPTYLNLLANGLRGWEGNGYWGGWGGIRKPANAPPGFLWGAPVKPVGEDDPGVGIGVAPAGSSANKTVAPAPGKPPGDWKPPVIPARTAAVNARFFAAAQNDFAARLKWSVTPKYGDANHAPKVRVEGPLEVTAAPGATVTLKASATDPDKNEVKMTWWQYNDAGTYPGDITLQDANSGHSSFVVPADAKAGQTIHVILEGTDDGVPALTSYQRVVVRVR